jgi:signal transduction histidine kinase
LGGAVFQPWFAVLLALYAVAAHGRRWEALVGAAATAVEVLTVDVPKLAAGDPVDEVLPAWFVLAGVWGLGRWIRHRHRETEALETRAAAAERESEEQAARAVADERARIARELHDLVAHSMGVIAFQAGAGRRVIESRPAEARNALDAIETTSREALAELRRTLAALRRAEPEGVPTAPAPGLADLDRLVATTADAGVRVDVERAGTVQPLPGDLDLSAYRIVQESVTNVVRHAGTDRCRVRLDYQEDALSIEVLDDGPGSGPSGTGYGLVGMRERVTLLDGRFDAGPGPTGGFRVWAFIPVPS